jgi:acetyltransferase-like isoleucine patch superfamily enzyme
LDGHNQLHIGRDVMIGPSRYFTDANHGNAPGSSVKSQPLQLASVIIEDEAWIGAHVVILPGVRIGKGAVIGAGAVVTRDVPAGAISCGVPARVTRQRRIVACRTPEGWRRNSNRRPSRSANDLSGWPTLADAIISDLGFRDRVARTGRDK